MKKLVSIVSVFALTLGLLATGLHAQPETMGGAEESLATMMASHRCSVLLPIATQTKDGINRVGAASLFTYEYIGPKLKNRSYRPVIFSQVIDKPWCAPDTMPLPTDQDFQKEGTLQEQQYILEKSLQIKAEFTKYLELINISAENIKGVSYGVKNMKAYNLSPKNQEKIVRALTADKSEACQRTLADKNSRLIIRVCTGEASLGVYFKKAISGEILNIAIGNLAKLGVTLKYNEEQSAVEDCKSSPPKPDAPKPAANDSKPTNAKPSDKPTDKPGTKPVVEAKPKSGVPQVTFTEADGKLSAQLQSGGDEAKPAGDSKPAGDVKPAATAAPDKCYKFAKFVADPDSVIGVYLSPEDSKNIDSLFQMQKRFR
jgi:hypothetical protein